MTPLGEKDRAEIEAALYAGHKVEAIKLYREAVRGAGLADAKTAVDQLEEKLRIEHPENFGPPSPKTGCLGIMAVGLGLLGSAWVVARFL